MHGWRVITQTILFLIKFKCQGNEVHFIFVLISSLFLPSPRQSQESIYSSNFLSAPKNLVAAASGTANEMIDAGMSFVHFKINTVVDFDARLQQIQSERVSLNI